MSSISRAIARVKSHWAKQAQEAQDGDQLARVGWLGSPMVHREHIHPQVSGDKSVGWLEWCMKTQVPSSTRRACVLGCGPGNLELHARWLGFNEIGLTALRSFQIFPNP